MELFKAFFLVALFAASPFGLFWLFEQLSTYTMFVGIRSFIVYAVVFWSSAFIAYAVAFVWITILVMIGLEEGP